MIDPHLEEDHRELGARVREFGERHLRAVARDEEAPVSRSKEIGALLGEDRLLAPVVPPPFGAMDARGVLVSREGLAYFSLLAEMVVAAQGLAARALDEAVHHTLARRQFGQPLAAFQATRMAIADMHAEIEAARRLARHAAWLADAGAEEASRAAAAARIVAAETAGRAVDRALQMHGAQGLVRGSTVERLFREAQALRLREGTNETVRLALAEAVLKESK